VGLEQRRDEVFSGVHINASDLGPVVVRQALRHYADAGISARFISSVDSVPHRRERAQLFVICSVSAYKHARSRQGGDCLATST